MRSGKAEGSGQRRATATATAIMEEGEAAKHARCAVPHTSKFSRLLE
eukprot:CAMPEP_0179164440 /NCGR_PEP_ID=MMETSP0796-20121207/80697_1 /TAXON_ID=73915 /ORGANISM="Pyrodinium bahamense, Strain pbaha01" /LENGTH=46 /DNA_ID= /DNA_START= /DNA_END= /DNA_ORIENTATION=